MMINTVVLMTLFIACFETITAQDTCQVDIEVDEKVYMFGYGYSYAPYEYLNEDGQLMGLGYDITRSICKVMNKKCEHVVYYDYSIAYNSKGLSRALDDGWYDALVNWLPTAQRKSTYKFCQQYANEPAAYMFVRKGSGMESLEDIQMKANTFGFRTGFKTSDSCLEKYLGISLSRKSLFYPDGFALETALVNGEVDVVFMDEIEVINNSTMSRVGNEPIRCALGGFSIMYRKDRDLSWFSAGLKKMRRNGDYEWLCNLNRNDVDPGCYED